MFAALVTLRMVQGAYVSFIKKKFYKLRKTFAAVCEDPCMEGNCIGPGICDCDPGFYGDTCYVRKCFSHSYENS